MEIYCGGQVLSENQYVEKVNRQFKEFNVPVTMVTDLERIYLLDEKKNYLCDMTPVYGAGVTAGTTADIVEMFCKSDDPAGVIDSVNEAFLEKLTLIPALSDESNVPDHAAISIWENKLCIYLLLKVRSINGTEYLPVTEELVKRWNLETEEIIRSIPVETAIFNARAIISGEEEDAICQNTFDPKGLYVMTNPEQNYGAVVMALRQDLIREFSDKCGKNVFILPSSAHEILLKADDGSKSVNEYRECVKYVNDSVLEPKDLLSYDVFYYDKTKDEIYAV